MTAYDTDPEEEWRSPCLPLVLMAGLMVGGSVAALLLWGWIW